MVGVDVGGIFTDAIAIAEDGNLRAAKVASTPADPSAGFEQALCELFAAGAAPGQVRLLGHGTTVATNALIMGRLARPGASRAGDLADGLIPMREES